MPEVGLIVGDHGNWRACREGFSGLNKRVAVRGLLVQSAFGDARRGQNGIQVSAPKARAVHLLESGLQEGPRVRSGFRDFAPCVVIVF